MAQSQQSSARNVEQMHAIQHIEIVTTDPVGLKTFLAKQFGWHFETYPMPTGDYHSFRTPDGNGGGVMSPQGPQPIAATPYINVADAEAKLKDCEAAGAKILLPITEVPGMGRFFWFQYPGAPPLACWQSLAAPK